MQVAPALSDSPIPNPKAIDMAKALILFLGYLLFTSFSVFWVHSGPFASLGQLPITKENIPLAVAYLGPAFAFKAIAFLLAAKASDELR